MGYKAKFKIEKKEIDCKFEVNKIENNATFKVNATPTKTSQLENDSGFITEAQIGLDDYYKKAEVDEKIDVVSDALGEVAEDVDVLKDTSATKEELTKEITDVNAHITTVEDEIDKELVSINEQLLTKASVDSVEAIEDELPNFATKSQIETIQGDITHLSGDIVDLSTNKQDAISDLDTIRSNAKTAKDTIDTYGDIVTHDVNEFMSVSTKYGADLSLSIDNTTYVVTAQLKDQNGNNLGTAKTIDLPLESVIVGGSYDKETKEVILTLNNGETIRFSVADLVSGLQKEITETNKLNADLVDDSSTTNKFVTTTDKENWNNKQDNITDLETIRDGAEKGATSIQPNDNISTLTNDSGYITDSYHDTTKYDANNPNGYTSNTGTVTSVNNVSPVNGNVTLSIPSEVTESTVSGWGFTKNTGTVTSVNNTSPVNGNVSIDIPDVTNFITKDVDDLTNYTKTDDLGMMAFADKVTNGDIDGTINQDKITDLATTLSGKQDTLVSATNIKTINGNSILGEGDLTVGGSDNVFEATYGTTTYADVKQALDDGKVVFCKYNSYTWYANLINSSWITFSHPLSSTTYYYLRLTSNSYWSSVTGVKFQEALTSGTNIKTINGESVLGSGDLTISSGASIDDETATTSTVYSSSKTETLVNNNKLTEGDNINITDNVISALSSATDKIIWAQSTLPKSVRWYSVIYGNGKFVAIASDTTITAYSSDGITWQSSTLPVSKSWRSVTYGNGKFVAVAGDSDISVYSEDGINWSQTTMPTSDNWNSVTYGNDKFVAVSWNSNVSAYSTDGINWVQTEMPTSTGWVTVTYGNGTFVAVTNSSSNNISAYSTDGINWVQSTLPANASWSTITYGDGKFVAVARNSDTSAYSTDGINWIQTTMPTSDIWFSSTYGGGKFVALGTSSVSAYSTDGINWVQSTLPVSKLWYSITYGDGKFVAISYTSNISIYCPSISPTNKIANCDLSNLSETGQAVIDNKQDVISDLETIRSGASLGATALQEVPSEYITETELSEYIADRANIDLSNLSDDGEAKVVNTRFDGQWVSITDSATHPLISSAGTLALEIDISSYIPSDGYLYEVMVHLAGYDNDSSYGYYLESDIFQPFTLSTTISNALNQIYGGTYARQTNNTLILPVKQYLYLYGAGADNVYVSLMGYRRIGTNI